MRAFSLAATAFACLVIFVSSAEARPQRHHVPAAAGLLGPGLIHMLQSADRHRAERSWPTADSEAQRGPLDALFAPFEPGHAYSFALPQHRRVAHHAPKAPWRMAEPYRAMAHVGDAVKDTAEISAKAALATGLVTVQTAANIPITVSSIFAPKIEGFIRDLVAEGYHPDRIHCFARSGHVAHSLHYSGNACDFDQTGWGKTAKPMYRVQALVAKWGLRNGCSFNDCGHIDAGFGGHSFAHRSGHHHRHYARS